MHHDLLVERHWVAEKGVDDVRVVVQLFVDDKSQNTHHGSAAVVQLDGELSVDGGLVPSRGSELCLLNILLASCVTKLDETDEEE